MRKILIITGNYGEGHKQAANALYKVIQLRQLNYEPIIIDFMEVTHPLLNPISHYIFINGIKMFPSIYGFFYRKTRAANSMSEILNKINNLGVSRLLKTIKEVEPSVIVSTFPLAAGAVSRLKEHGYIDVPTVTVITDHTYHSSWIHDNTDRYIISSEYVKEDLQSLGVPKEKIAVTGIPIRPEFCHNLSVDPLRTKHGINPSIPVVLIMGGGVGIIGDGSTTIRALENLPKKVQIIVVCGYNDKLKKQLSRELSNSKHEVILLGHVDYIHELMAISDMLITKPGGLTTSEAVASELPMLLFKPLPGQEQDNAKLLTDLGVAFQAKNTKEMIEVLSFSLFTPEILNKMRGNAKKIHRKWAAFEALDVIDEVQNATSSHGTPMEMNS
ncbi:MAG TPA: 1,2-diacylglycerol 3-glucosyltransferase [Paenibacillaceae bacterium]|nr:1,2-diacylglycerol 3-glucosyltransferase [Paenibacillaceae bacterium]